MKRSNVGHSGSLLFIQRGFKNAITSCRGGLQDQNFFGVSLGINGFAFKV